MRRKRTLAGAAAAAIALGGTVAVADTDPTQAQQTVTITVTEAPLAIQFLDPGDALDFEFEVGDEPADEYVDVFFGVRNGLTEEARISVRTVLDEPADLADFVVMIRGYTGGSNSQLGPDVEAMDLGDFDDFDQEYGLLISKDSPKGQAIEKPMFGRVASGIDFLDSIDGNSPTMEFNVRGEVTTATNVEIVFTFIIEASGSSD